jgi:hypothetical protein
MEKSSEIIQDLFQFDKNKSYFIWTQRYIYDVTSEVFLDWEIFQTSFVEEPYTFYILKNVGWIRIWNEKIVVQVERLQVAI